MDKPHLVILMHYLELGGAEMALIGLLHALDPNKVDVDLFIYSHRGPLMKYIPKWVNVLPEIRAYSAIEEPMVQALRRGCWGVALGRFVANCKYRNYRKKYPAEGDDGAIMQYVGDYVTPWLPMINPDIEYDLCISFLTPHNIGRDKVRAKKRLAWIHTDYSTVSINPDIELPVWAAYNKIASISDGVTKSFLTQFPTLSPKIIQVENILSSDFVRHRSTEQNVASQFTGKVNLLSIGRYCTAKNYDNVPEICKLLRNKGIDIKWYIIGYGGSEQLIREKINEAGMRDYVILLGKKDNPYPYIKACDIYVQPSRYEGKSVTVREAQILHKPVVVTNYPTAASQIKDNVDGVIVPLDNEGCAKGLADFITNRPLQEKIITNLTKGDYANISEVEKIYQLFE